ncbi:MAG: hypothetical protein Q7S32_04370 [bacterium]|nr:hypothetical protein [bacterium]
MPKPNYSHQDPYPVVTVDTMDAVANHAMASFVENLEKEKARFARENLASVVKISENEAFSFGVFISGVALFCVGLFGVPALVIGGCSLMGIGAILLVRTATKYDKLFEAWKDKRRKPSSCESCEMGDAPIGEAHLGK